MVKFLIIVFTLSLAISAMQIEYLATSENIIKHAEQIVICEVVGAESDTVMFKVIEMIKGKCGKDTLFYKGTIDNYKGRGEALLKYPGPPYERVRGDGAPHAYDYELGKQFLLFIRDDTPYWSSHAATNEEVTGQDDLWVLLVKGYLEEGPSIYAKLGLNRPNIKTTNKVDDQFDIIKQLRELENESH